MSQSRSSLEVIGGLLVNHFYDDQDTHSLQRVFNYQSELTSRQDIPFKQLVRMIILIPLCFVAGQSLIFQSHMIQINKVTVVTLYLTILTLLLTILSVSTLFKDKPYIMTVRKITHTLSCLLFFVMFWQSAIYFVFLREAYL